MFWCTGEQVSLQETVLVTYVNLVGRRDLHNK